LHAYEAAQAAETARDALIAQGESFIAETVASHDSKVDLVRRARAAGYFVHVVAVVVPEEYAVERVRARVAVGGHDVPEEKIRSRWRRLWGNVVKMIELADSAEVFDNSGRGPGTIATFVAGDIVGAPRWPDWTPESLTARWPVSNRPR
jgi:predicted ABC-type ATPase